MIALSSALAQNPPASKPSSLTAEKTGKPTSASSRKTAPAAPPAAQMPDPTPIPSMSPEDLPAMAPRVSYRDGELRVDTENSRLGDVLNAIGTAIGALIDKPPAADTERVAAHLSGPPRRVIAALLDDARYGYAILYPMGDPTGVQKIVLRSQAPEDVRPVTAPTSQLANRRAAMTSQPSRPANPETEVGLTPEFSASAAQESRKGSQPPPSATSVRAANDSDPGASVTSDTLLQDNMAHANKQLTEVTAQLSATSANADGTASPSPVTQATQQGTKTPMQVLQDLIQARRQLQEQQNQAQKSQPAQ